MSGAIALLLACSVAAAPGPDDRETIDISVLSLLRPARIQVSCQGSATVERDSLPPEALGPHAALEIRLDGGGLAGALLAGGERRRLEAAPSYRIAPDDARGALEVRVIERHAFQRRFRGELLVRPGDSALVLVLRAPLEQVVAETAVAEMGADAPAEALRAMAVVARSFVLAQRGRHAEEGFDICDTTHCIAYRGLDGAFGAGEGALEKGRTAAAETEGLVLTSGGAPLPAFFHACCGGHTATPGMIWMANPDSGFSAVKCPYCAESANFRWRSQRALSGIAEALGLDESKQWKVVVDYFETAPYVRQIRFTDGEDTHAFSAERFRMGIGRGLGWDVVRSNSFTLEQTGGRLAFEGRGYGHGVGLCQDGASGAALQGLSYRQILLHYFPRCTVTRLGR